MQCCCSLTNKVKCYHFPSLPAITAACTGSWKTLKYAPTLRNLCISHTRTASSNLLMEENRSGVVGTAPTPPTVLNLHKHLEPQSISSLHQLSQTRVETKTIWHTLEEMPIATVQLLSIPTQSEVIRKGLIRADEPHSPVLFLLLLLIAAISGCVGVMVPGNSPLKQVYLLRLGFRGNVPARVSQQVCNGLHMCSNTEG